MTFDIPSNLLKPITPKAHANWALWEKKNFNIHRGLIEFTAPDALSIHDLANQVREGVREEFRPGWFRGFGFGAIIHFPKVPADFTEICQHVDTRNKLHGVWQWVVVCLDEEKVALGIHTWLHGYLRPVYDSVLEQLKKDGYNCESVDSEMDALIAKLQQIAKTCRMIRSVGRIIT